MSTPVAGGADGVRRLLVIGAQRCGTTYVHDLLAAHPQIAMARPARPEPKVFCSEELSARGVEWYDATYFSHARPGQLRGEKSTSYLETAEAAERAHRMLGDAAVLVSLRDPVERAVSHWAFSTDNGLESRPLATALEDGLRGPRAWNERATSVSPFAYLERGRYAGYLAPWSARFGDGLVVVFLAELRGTRSQDERAVSDLYRALGVDPAVKPAVGGPVNRSAAPAPALDPELTARLRDYFADSDAALSELLGRDLPWGPARAGGGTDGR